LFPGIPS